MKRALFLSFTVFALGISAHSVADTYAAIAYSPSTGSTGYARGQWSQWEAEAAAINACRQYAWDCQTAVWVRNGCAALAGGNGRFGWGWGETANVAGSNAVAACGWGCGLAVWTCSY